MSVFEKLKLNRTTRGQHAQQMCSLRLEEGNGYAQDMSLLEWNSLFSFTTWSPVSGISYNRCRSSPCTRVVPINILGNAHADLKLIFVCDLVFRTSWTPAGEDKLVFFPTTRTQKRYPINVHRRDRVQTM